ncbi:hypothetical protein D3C77_753510 [compost metagenome]
MPIYVNIPLLKSSIISIVQDNLDYLQQDEEGGEEGFEFHYWKKQNNPDLPI